MHSDAQNVTEFLLEGKPGHRTALHLLNGTNSYGELRQYSTSVARHCIALGLQKGDRVVLACDNSLTWVAAYLGIMQAGMVCVPLPPSISLQDFQYIVDNINARVAFLQSSFALKSAALLNGVHVVTDRKIKPISGVSSQWNIDDLRANPPDLEDGFHNVTPNDLAAIMFTSGSTGKPRGVMVSHGNIIANTLSIIEYLGLTPADRMMTVLPFHYCFGTSLLHTHLRVGGSLVLDPRFMYPESVLQRMVETECTGFAGVPSHFQILLRSSTLSKKSFPRLRYVQQAGGQLAPVFIKELKQALPNVQIFVMYGQTEATARLSYLPPELLETKLGSVGRGIPGVLLRVLDKDGNPTRPGSVGEIVAEGQNITLGYWREPEETANSFRDGALYTGDLATVDDDNFIYIVDRAKDFLKCGGKRISCHQIENQLQEFECLLEAAVLGTPDEVLGEAVRAFLVARMPGCPQFQECFRVFCKEHLLPQLLPKEVVLMRALPKNNSGKVIKSKLADHPREN